MEEPYQPSDEDLELQEYLAAAEELAIARSIEEAEFIRDQEDGEEEDDDDDTGGEVQEPAPQIIANGSARRSYWEAQSLVELEIAEFETALAAENIPHLRSAYFRLASYHARSLAILHGSLTSQKEALLQASIRNLATLHRAMMQMRQKAPHAVPETLLLDRNGRNEYGSKLMMDVLQESSSPLDLDDITSRVDELTGSALRKGTIERNLKDLASSGYIQVTQQHPAQYQNTQRSYSGIDLDVASLRALLGSELYAQLGDNNFHGLTDVFERQSAFRDRFCQITDLSETTAALIVDLIETVLEIRAKKTSHWIFSDLIGSAIPRPYQFEAYAVFRGYGYQGQLVEAPTGSGKTMIGMMCIQDWLKKLNQGQSILVLVPTSNYLQQWTGELCYKSIGLHLSPEMVFAGTPNQLEQFKKRTGSHPAVLLMTYTSLSQAGSAIGKGGFDIDSIEMFLQGANVQYVVLDEVHKVAANLMSVSSNVIRLMTEWLRDGSLRGLVGFTGTAEAYRSRFVNLGLELVYSIPIDELIAAGYVAPFAELGFPFAYSSREREIRNLLDRYKELTGAFMRLIGDARLRSWFADIPLEERIAIGHNLLSMYQGRGDWQAVLPNRLGGWEKGAALALTEAKLVTIVQIARRWSDKDLVAAAKADDAQYSQIMEKINSIRSRLNDLIYLPITLKRLRTAGFGAEFHIDEMYRQLANMPTQAGRSEIVKDFLAETVVGLYENLSEWYRRIGEGRVETIKAIIEAERSTRAVSGIIIFDQGRRIIWKKGNATPGYEGLGGLYAQLLGDERFIPYAVLSSEQYLPYSDENPLTISIARFIERQLMRGEIAQAMLDLALQGLDLPIRISEEFYQRWFTLIEDYVPRLKSIRSARPADFRRFVLRPMRRFIQNKNLGRIGERILSRLDLRNIHYADLVGTFFDYAIIARSFSQAKVAQLEQTSGKMQKFFVIPMASGNRKLLMYDLTSRIVDEESLPINVIIVSSWARTGWNVITPNLLIDATATRDVTAWQQLRGRAIRARRTWSNDCYRLIVALIGSQMHGLSAKEDLPEDVLEIMEQVDQTPPVTMLDDRLQTLLEKVASGEQCSRVMSAGLAGLTQQERLSIAISLMRRYNKVTHIYELVKAYGSTTQIEYNRPAKLWQRQPNIAAKHEFEIAVNPLDGAKLSGVTHAPLIYENDPRSDSPSVLQQKLVQVITGSDQTIVSGWMQYSLSDQTYPSSF